jgi:hypothetical protein
MSRPTRSCRSEAQTATHTITIHSKPTPVSKSITFKHFPSVGIHCRPKSSSPAHSVSEFKEANDRQAAVTSLYPPTPSEKKFHTDYLNRECMTLICQQVDQVTENILRMEQVSNECIQFFDMFDPRMQPQRKEGLAFKPIKYEPTLLPVVICRCYPNLPDRSLIVKGLAKELERQTHRRSCVCVLRSRRLENDSLLAEVLSQVRIQ